MWKSVSRWDFDGERLKQLHMDAEFFSCIYGNKWSAHSRVSGAVMSRCCCCKGGSSSPKSLARVGAQELEELLMPWRSHWAEQPSVPHRSHCPQPNLEMGSKRVNPHLTNTRAWWCWCNFQLKKLLKHCRELEGCVPGRVPPLCLSLSWPLWHPRGAVLL